MQPLQKISIPRHFLDSHFDVERLLQRGLHIQILADGNIDPQLQHVTLYKYQNPHGWVQYKVNGMADAYHR